MPHSAHVGGSSGGSQAGTHGPPSGASGPAGAVHYRYRSGSTVSTWMTADQLKEAALRGELSPESHIQQAGHVDWVPANLVRGLTFPAPALAAEVEAPSLEAPAPASTAGGRHPRFATLKDLLANFVNAEIEINLPDPTEFAAAQLCMAGNDHFEVMMETGRSRVFLPYGRIRAIWATETSTSATLTYRDSHRLTVELDAKR